MNFGRIAAGKNHVVDKIAIVGPCPSGNSFQVKAERFHNFPYVS
jgi:hypothetical protein